MTDDSTLDNDVFDGIEDIYADLEANPPPPPPSSEDDILNTTTSSSSSSSVGINQNDQSVEYERGFPYLCGMQSSKDAPRMSVWNIFGGQSYHEMEEKTETKTPKETAPEPSTVMANGGEQIDKVELENIPADEKDASIMVEEKDELNTTDAANDRDVIIQHTIVEVKEEPVKKAFPSVRDILRQKNLFRASKESAQDDTIERTTDEDETAMDTIKKLYQSFVDKLTGNTDEARIRRKYHPSLWDTLGQRELFGVSYRLLLLISVNFFALLLLIILIARFAGRKSDSLIDSSTSIEAPSVEEESNDVSAELRALCEKDGVTIEDGVILTSNQVFENGKYYCSPSKTYLFGMMDDLAILDINANEVVWSAGVTGGARTILQEDGNMVIENEVGEMLWSTEVIPGSEGFSNPRLVFWENNDGVIAIQQIPNAGVSETPYNFWMGGMPKVENCDDCQTDNLEFPVRGTFYVPTYDNTETAWQDRPGNVPRHYPSLGYYSSSDPNVVTAHVEAMEYGQFNLAISSWEGPGTNFDRSRITMLLEETQKQNADLKWTVTYEEELLGPLKSEDIQSDLEYLKTWFTWQKSWARIDGKPVIFVNNGGGCDVAERWMESAATDWYVVLKTFGGYERCEYQPHSWHDQRVNDNNDGIDFQEGLYYNLAPGQWRMGRPRPDLERLSPREWCRNVRDMVASNEQWQLIVSFNDAESGTSIEPSFDWRSNSRYGFFLDCLHDPQMF